MIKPALSTARRFSALLALAATLVCGFAAGRLLGDQPHMHTALEHLRAAKQQLEVADADKGGHRVKALRLVEEAIGQVEHGIQYDRKH
jgi:hypothetical protein